MGHCLHPPSPPKLGSQPPAQVGLRRPPSLDCCNSLVPGSLTPMASLAGYWSTISTKDKDPTTALCFKVHHIKTACQSTGLSCSEVPRPLHRLFPLMKMTEMAFFCLHTNSHSFNSKANSSVRPSQSNLTLIWQKVTLPLRLCGPWAVLQGKTHFVICGYLQISLCPAPLLCGAWPCEGGRIT